MLQQWDVKRLLAKTNYTLHTDAIKTKMPKVGISKFRQRLIYATEADLLNLILFGCEAEDWRNANPDLAKKGMNLRDTATINQLVVLSNIEAVNAELILRGIPREERWQTLHHMAKRQLAVLNEYHAEQRFKKLLGNDPLALPE